MPPKLPPLPRPLRGALARFESVAAQLGDAPARRAELDRRSDATGQLLALSLRGDLTPLEQRLAAEEPPIADDDTPILRELDDAVESPEARIARFDPIRPLTEDGAAD